MSTTPAISAATLRVLFLPPTPQPNSIVNGTISLHGSVSLSSGKFLKLGAVTVTFSYAGPSVKANISGDIWYCDAVIPQSVPQGTAISITVTADVSYIPQGYPSSEPDAVRGTGTLNVVLGTLPVQPKPLINVQLFTAVSSKAQHPTVDVTVPATFKIIGGGAFDNWTGAGNLLTASYPLNAQTWRASGKDHVNADPAVITAYALAIEDPTDVWDVHIVSNTSQPVSHPITTASLPAGYVMTGGGAFDNYHGSGNMLTASFPSSDSVWEVHGKDHASLSDPAAITAYAIGIKHKTGKIIIQHQMKTVTSGVAAHPSETVSLDPGWILSGGGACDNYKEPGNLLTASYPVSASTWYAAGKDQISSSPSTMIVTVIGILATSNI